MFYFLTYVFKVEFRYKIATLRAIYVIDEIKDLFLMLRREKHRVKLMARHKNACMSIYPDFSEKVLVDNSLQ